MAGVKEEMLQPRLGPGQATPLPGRSAESFGAAIGRGVSEFGDTLQSIARKAQEADRERAAEAENAQVGVANAQLVTSIDGSIEQRRIEAQPDAAGHLEAVTADLSAQRDTFLNGIKDRRVRERWAPVIERQLQERISREDGWVRGRRVKAIGDAFTQGGEEWGKLAFANPQPETLTAAYGAIDGQIAGFAGRLAPEQLEQLGKEQRGKVQEYWARGLAQNNPAAALGAIQTGLLPDLTAEQTVNLSRLFTNGVEAQQLQADRAARAQVGDAREAINLLQKRFDDGDPTITDQDLQHATQLATAAGLPGEVWDLGKARVRLDVRTKYKDAPSGEIRQALDTVRSRIASPGKGKQPSPYDVIAEGELQTLLTRKTGEERTDPQGVYAGAGGRTTTLLPDGPLDPGSIRGKVQTARAAERQTGQLALFNPQETQAWQALVQSGPDGKARAIGLLADIATLDPRAALKGAQQIAPNDPTVRIALRLPPQTAGMVLRGSAARASLADTVTNEDGQKVGLNRMAQDWFASHAQPALRNAAPQAVQDTLTAAIAIYDEWRRMNGKGSPDAPFNEGAFRNAMSLALGGDGRRGGIGQWQGKPIALPPSLSQEEFDQRLSSIPLARLGEKWPVGSINGNPLYADGRQMGADTIRGFTPMHLGGGLYQFRKGAQVIMTRDGSGRLVPWEMRPDRLPVRHSGAAAAAAPGFTPRGQWEIPTPGGRGPTWVAPPERR